MISLSITLIHKPSILYSQYWVNVKNRVHEIILLDVYMWINGGFCGVENCTKVTDNEILFHTDEVTELKTIFL